jgi:hypothetical protein
MPWFDPLHPDTAVGAPDRESRSESSSAGNLWNRCNLWPAGSVDPPLNWTQQPAPASNRRVPANPRNLRICRPLNRWPPMAQNQLQPPRPALDLRPQDRSNKMNRIRPVAGTGLSPGDGCSQSSPSGRRPHPLSPVHQSILSGRILSCAPVGNAVDFAADDPHATGVGRAVRAGRTAAASRVTS